MSKDRMQEAYKKMQRIYHKQHTQYIKVKFATSSFEYMYRKKINKKWILMDRNLSNQLSVAEALAGC